jgi:hypothetical protein
MESARKASELHFKRTGKELDIREDYVKEGVIYPEKEEVTEGQDKQEEMSHMEHQERGCKQ